MKNLEQNMPVIEAMSLDDDRPRTRARTRRQSLLRRSFVGFLIMSGILLSPLTSRWPDFNPFVRDIAIIFGTLVLGAGLAIRLWAGLYIGGHKERRLIVVGPYSCVRNPLYLGNLVTAGGIGVITGSPYVIVLVLGAMLAVYLVTIRQEEQKLYPIFGAAYQTYLWEVPPLLPHLSSVRHLIHDETPCTITHFSLARELKRCLGLAALGFLAFLLAMSGPFLHTLLPAAL